MPIKDKNEYYISIYNDCVPINKCMNEKDIIHAVDICFVDRSRAKDEYILVDHCDRVNVLHSGMWMRVL